MYADLEGILGSEGAFVLWANFRGVGVGGFETGVEIGWLADVGEQVDYAVECFCVSLFG